MVFSLRFVLWSNHHMSIPELILSIATLLTPVLAAWLTWQQKTISQEIVYLKKRLDQCLDKED